MRKAPAKGLSVMERKVPRSEKYAHVRGVLDTGLTVNKVKPVTAREYAKRRDEIFFRVTKLQLYDLYSEYEQSEYETISEAALGTGGGDPRVVTYLESDRPEYDKPYLILDTRELDAFNRCHLLQARSFPYAMLRRDQYPPEIYQYRNKPETLIIVYCDDERVSRDAAKVLVDRGIDNIFLLTGGMNEFAYDYPAFVEGVPPSPPKHRETMSGSLPRSQPKLGKIPENEEHMPSSPVGKLTQNKLDRLNQSYSHGGPALSSGRRSIRDAKSEVGTSASTKSVAESVISRATARKGRF